MNRAQQRACRLLVVTDAFPLTPDEGSLRGLFVADMCTRLAQFGHVVSVLAPGVALAQRQAPFEGIQVERFGWRGRVDKVASNGRRWHDPLTLNTLMETGSYFRRGLAKARQESMRLRPHLTLSIGVFPSGAFARGLRDLFGIPYMVWGLGHDLDVRGYPWRGPVMRQVLNQALFCGADSQTLADSIVATHNRSCEFLPSTLAASADAAAKHEPIRQFVCFCPNEPDEGVSVAIDAFALAAPQMRRAELTVVGAGGVQTALMKRAETQRMASRIRFVERPKTRKKSRQLVTQADVVVIPDQRATLPHSFTEAVGLRRPVLTSSVGDLPALTEGLGVGRVFPSGDAAELADLLWQTYHQGLVTSESAWALANDRISLETTATRLNAILEEAQNRAKR